jgi:hypothetical protein
MDEKSKATTSGSNFAQHGVATILSLDKLLRRDGKNYNMQELTLKIPLLGKVHIRRNSYTPQAPRTNNPSTFQTPANSSIWKQNERLPLQEYGRLPSNTDSQVASAL